MKNLVQSFFYVSMCLLFVNCNSEEVILTTNSAAIVRALDAGNQFNANDILVSFQLKKEANQNIQKISIVLIPSSDYPSRDPIIINKLAENSLFSVPLKGNTYRFRLPVSMKDISDQIIKRDIAYTLLILFTIDDQSVINEEVTSITLTDGHYLSGKYTGTWNDNLYTNFPISAELTFQDNELKGPFYYGGIFFSPCCGGNNDGSLVLKLEGEETISSFLYRQTLDNFQGGLCSGRYEGDGKLTNIKTLSINFSGNDCEGEHTGGKISLVRR